MKKKKNFLVFIPAILMTIVFIVFDNIGIPINWIAISPIWILVFILFFVFIFQK